MKPVTRARAERIVARSRARVIQVVSVKGAERWQLLLPGNRVRTLKVVPDVGE